jgi:hypothetical protein
MIKYLPENYLRTNRLYVELLSEDKTRTIINIAYNFGTPKINKQILIYNTLQGCPGKLQKKDP